MTQSMWRLLDDDFRRYPRLAGTPAGDDEIDEAAIALEWQLPPDYRDFLRRYGSAIVGRYPIYGIRPALILGRDWSVVEINRRYREDQWPGVDGWLIISTDHGGNPFGFAPDGRIWISDHEFGVIEPVAENFEHFLRKECLELLD
jgi:hypothetical protein